jgi:hypothetical protein
MRLLVSGQAGQCTCCRDYDSEMTWRLALLDCNDEITLSCVTSDCEAGRRVSTPQQSAIVTAETHPTWLYQALDAYALPESSPTDAAARR